MTMGRVELRSMRAHEVGDVARLHRLMFPSNVASRFGPRLVHRYVDTFRSSPGAVALVAERDGALSGYLLGVTRTDRHRAFVRPRRGGLILVALPRMPRNAWFILKVLRRRLARRSSPQAQTDGPGPLAVLSHLATREDARGCGIGGDLVMFFELEALKQGAVTGYLATDDQPAGAARFYEGLEWHLDRHDRTADGRVLRIYRKTLAP